MFAVVGSGFGLYGYLPALVEVFGEPVLLQESYREKAAARAELRPYLGSVRWTRDTEDSLRSARGVVIATPPERQAQIISRCAEFPALETWVLEKPIACSPLEATAALAKLREAGKRVRVGYTLLHAGWMSEARFSDGGTSIRWTFMAHHFANAIQTWKREAARGGGVLRFFGIHLLPLLSQQGYDRVVSSHLSGADPTQPDRWEATFARSAAGTCSVLVDSRAPDTRFSIDSAGESCVVLKEPFELEGPAAHGGDRRVGVLERILRSLDSGADQAHYGLYDRVNRLWLQVEGASQFSSRVS